MRLLLLFTHDGFVCYNLFMNTMIKTYLTGSDFVSDNEQFLNTNKYLSCFFVLDATLLNHVDCDNYAIKVTNGRDTLLALKVVPYSLMLFGSTVLTQELSEYLLNNGLLFDKLLGDETLCQAFADSCSKYGICFDEFLAMDFMEATTVTEPTSPEVVTATESDFAEILECIYNFMKNCNLDDPVNEQKYRDNLHNIRLIKQDNKVVSIAVMAMSTEEDVRIVNVYTRPEYRGKGYARKVVNAVKNEILSLGKKATLNVDKANPISNHVYKSIGFVRLFSHGEFHRSK